MDRIVESDEILHFSEIAMRGKEENFRLISMLRRHFVGVKFQEKEEFLYILHKSTPFFLDYRQAKPLFFS